MFMKLEQGVFDLLSYVAGFTHDWGIAVIVLTVVIRMLLLPISIRVARNSLLQMQLSPKVKHLQATWKGSKEELLRTQSQLMRDHGVKPFTSVVLLMIQSPIFLTLYRALRHISHPVTSVLLPWVPYLTQADPLHIVPIAAAILMAAGAFVTYQQVHAGTAEVFGGFVSFVTTLLILWASPVAVAIYYTTSGVWGTMERITLGKLIGRKLAAQVA